MNNQIVTLNINGMKKQSIDTIDLKRLLKVMKVYDITNAAILTNCNLRDVISLGNGEIEIKHNYAGDYLTLIPYCIDKYLMLAKLYKLKTLFIVWDDKKEYLQITGDSYIVTYS